MLYFPLLQLLIFDVEGTLLLLYVLFVTCSCDQEHILRLRIRMCVQSLSRVQPFYNPMDCSPPGSSAHGISQAGILEWGCHFLLQGIFPTQGSNLRLLCLLHWQADSLSLCHLGSPWRLGLIFIQSIVLSTVPCTPETCRPHHTTDEQMSVTG